jgi:hypothetical protein
MILNILVTANGGISLGAPPDNRALGPSTFPLVEGANLEDRRFRLPEDFEGGRNIVLIAFEREQQAEVDTWLPLARSLESEIPGVRSYELPTIRELPGVLRGWITGGMARGIPDAQARASTITLFLDKDEFRRALQIRSEKTITVVVTDREGRICWQTTGTWTPEKEAALRRVLVP